MLAVVEDEEQAAVPEIFHQGFDDRPARGFLDPQHARHGLRHEARVVHGCELDQPDAIREFVDQIGADLQRKPALSDAAHAEQGQEPELHEQLLHFAQLGLAADERRELVRQVVGRRLERTQRRELVPQARVQELVEGFGRSKIAQADRAELAQPHLLRQAAAHHARHRVRKQHLSAVRRAHDARGAVDGRAVEVAVARLSGAGVQAAAHLQGYAGRRLRIGERELQLYRRAERVASVVENGMQAVARLLHHHAAIALHRRARDGVVLGERRPHPLRVLFPHPRAAFDVGEEIGPGFGLLVQVKSPRHTVRQMNGDRLALVTCAAAVPAQPVDAPSLLAVRPRRSRRCTPGDSACTMRRQNPGGHHETA